MAIKRWNASTSQWELVGTPGTATPSAIGAASIVSSNTFASGQIIRPSSGTALEVVSLQSVEPFIIARAVNPSGVITRVFNGTYESPTAITANQRTSFFASSMYGATSYNNNASVNIYAAENQTDTARGSYINFETTTSGTVGRTEKMRIESNGSIGVGSANTATFNPDSAYNKVIVLQQTDQVMTLGSYWQAGVGQSSFINSSQSSSRTAASNLFFQTGGVNRLLIESNGNMQMPNNGVDTLRYFDIYNTSSGNSAGAIIRLITNNAANSAVTTVDIVKYRNGYLGILNNDPSATIGFGTAGVERMRISSAGQVGVGTDNPQARVHSIAASGGSPLLLGMVASDTTSWIQPKVQRNGFGQQAAWLYTPSTVDASNPVWYTGLNASRANFTFSTFDAVNFTERVHITPAGYMLIGYSTSNGSYSLQVNSQIFATSSSIATSDGRYKENVLPITSGLDIIDSLNPVSFDWKEHPVHNFVPGKTVGFIAQEVQEALSDYEWVDNIIKTNTTEAVLDEDGNEITPAEEFLGIAESNIIPLLVAAVKELRAEVNTLKAQLSN